MQNYYCKYTISSSITNFCRIDFIRFTQEGGSWEVRVSLAAVGQWLRSLGRIPSHLAFQDAKSLPMVVSPPVDEVAKLSSNWTQSNCLSDGKRMTALRHAAILSETPVKEGEAPVVLNSSSPSWILKT